MVFGLISGVIPLVFEIFIFKPVEVSLKSSSRLKVFLAEYASMRVKVVSSAYATHFVQCFGVGSKPSISTELLIAQISGSTANMKRYKLSGSPCLTPFCKSKGLDKKPLLIILDFASE